ncbi:hypothetical protein ACP4OV_000643 [Aristida adscensionis]
MSELRDWGGLPELPLAEVLRRLLPCLRSLYAFAATCRPWRRLLRSSAAYLLRPRLPPLRLVAAGSSRRAEPFSPLIYARPLPAHRGFAPGDANLLSASRGHLILLRRRDRLLVVADALTGAERRALPLPSPHFAYHCAALLPSHLLLFHSKHAFFSLPSPLAAPNPNPSSVPAWAEHGLPRAASFVTGVLEFRGRVLGLTDRAQLLEFRLGASPPSQAVQPLPAAGLPDATMFDRCHFGPRLAAAGGRLLLVLFILESKGAMIQAPRRVLKVSVFGLDMAQMVWEEVDSIAPYSLFVDCAGKSVAACVDVGSCGVEENRIYVAAPGRRNWRAFPPGWEAAPHPFGGGGDDALFFRRAMKLPPWPSQIWFHPQLFF